MRLLLSFAMTLMFCACGRSGSENDRTSRRSAEYYAPTPTGGCLHQHQDCTPTMDPFNSGCPAGFGCFPDKRCTSMTGCGGFCVDMKGSDPRVHFWGTCEACGPCVFPTGGITGSSGPNGCRTETEASGECCDQGGTCLMD
jgi:hypothetical protein